MKKNKEAAFFRHENKLNELEKEIREYHAKGNELTTKERNKLQQAEAEYNKLLETDYSHLSAWERVLLARSPRRPKALDYIAAIFENYIELHGDRYFGDDPAIITGLAMFKNRGFAVIGQQKGNDVEENVRRNFAMAHPEGYRKALRIMQLADRFSLPIVIFIDTPGAYPGIGAEERGQAEAIAKNIKEMFKVKVPIIIFIIGEGASGGALGIGVGDAVLMLENTWYCVISPEGCASILWKDREKAPEVAELLKLSPPDLLEFGVIDEIVPEPRGGAHRNPQQTFDNTREVLIKYLDKFSAMTTEELQQKRYEKFRNIGSFQEKKNKRKKNSAPGKGAL